MKMRKGEGKGEDMIGITKLEKRTGVPIQTLYNWLYAGIFEPVGKRIYRGREFNTFSEKTIREVLTIKALREFVSFQAMRKAGKILRSYGHNPFSKGTFLVVGTGDKVDIVKAKDGEFIELTGKYAGQLLLPLWTIKENRRKRK